MSKLKNRIVLNTSELKAMCSLAERRKFSHGPNDRFWHEVDPAGQHFVGMWFVHKPCFALWRGVPHPWDFTVGGGRNIRATVLCKMKNRREPVFLLCDFDLEDWTARLKRAGGGMGTRSRSKRLKRAA